MVRWKGGESEWIPLKDLKDANPIEVAEYAHANKIQDEPAFKWWTHHVLRQRNQMINNAIKKGGKSKYWRTTHKFGIEFPHLAKEALAIDRRTNTNSKIPHMCQDPV